MNRNGYKIPPPIPAIRNTSLKSPLFYANIPLKAGEKMAQYTELENAREILKYLKADIPVFYYDTIDSTNTQAKRFYEKHKHDSIDTPTLFVADHQSKGKGRLGRSFYSPSRTGLYMSLMIKADNINENIVCLTTAVSVCVTDALTQLCDIDPKIKWVNDIYVNDKKICGILCEALTNPDSQKIDAIIIGIGVNIDTKDFPKELSDIATSVGQAVNRNELCAKITDNIIDMCKTIDDRKFIEKYKARSLVLNREITYFENGLTKSATAIDIDNNGGLIIQSKNGIKTLSTGEITVRLKND